MNNGWIKLHRSLVNWEWYDDDKTLRLLIHLLMTVNYKDKKWKGEVVKAGSLATSWDSLEREIKSMSKQQIRTAMSKLESCNEVTRNVTGRFQVITLVKWDNLQSLDNLDNIKLTAELTGNQQQVNRKITPTKEKKEYKEVNKYIYDLKSEYLSNDRICNAVINNKKNKIANRGLLEILLEQFNVQLESTNQNIKTFKDYTAHFLSWNRKDKKDKVEKKEVIINR